MQSVTEFSQYLQALFNERMRLARRADKVLVVYRTGENFDGGKFRAIKILPYLENFAVLIPPSTCIIFVSSATHEKREIKNTSNIFYPYGIV